MFEIIGLDFSVILFTLLTILKPNSCAYAQIFH